MSVHRLLAVLLFGGLLCVPALPQQAPAPAQAPAPPKPAPIQPENRIEVQVNEVIIPVTVTDHDGKFVSNLTAEDFQVLDEGKPQRIRFFSHNEKQPIVVGFLLDLSNAMRVHWTKYQEAAKELVWELLPGDQGNRYSGYLITYSNEAEVAVNTTYDSEKITAKIDKLKPGGAAALYDAIHLACTKRELVHGEPYEPRRIIVVIGDGHDSSSHHTLDQVLELAQRNLVSIYGVSTVAFGFSVAAQGDLERMASETGGHIEYPLNTLYKDVSGYLSTPSDEGNYALKVGTGGYAAEIASNIMKAIAGITHEVTTQYVLRYVPDVDPEEKPKVFRRIKVQIPMLPNVKIHARNGYYPMGVPKSTSGAANSQ